MEIESKIPQGPLERKWELHQRNLKLLAPGSRSRYKILVVGTGLAGSSAAATLGELGYRVELHCLQDSPRRAHSIAA